MSRGESSDRRELGCPFCDKSVESSATGDNAVWFMNGTTLAVTASLPSVPDTNWKIVRLADFQGDGKSDILWRHSTTGSNAQWLMNGPAIAVSSTFPPVPDATWEVAGRP